MIKRKKNTLTALSVMLILLTHSQQLIQAQSFTVAGKINGQLNARQAFITYKNNGLSIADSVRMNNGAFVYKGISNGPVFVKVAIDYTGSGIKKATDNISFYAAGTDIHLQSNDSVKKAVVTGSPLHDEYLEYKKLDARYFSANTLLNARWANATKDEKEGTSLKDSLAGVRKILTEEKKAAQIAYIQSKPGSYFSLVALKELAGSKIDVSLYEPVFKGLAENVKNTPAGIDFAEQLEKGKLTVIGAEAPNFTQNDTQGKAVQLSSFRGQYVLIDFWASWCGPCRRENPNLVAAYHKYKDRGFTILGVSLDSKKDPWLKAIEADKLYWTHVSDLKYWDNAVAQQYGIRSVPANLLLDKEGKIIARNLRGEELGQTLETMLPVK